MDQLYLHAHDLKGLGTTYEYPLISRVAEFAVQAYGRAGAAHGPMRRSSWWTPTSTPSAPSSAARSADPEHPVGRALSAGAGDCGSTTHIAAANGFLPPRRSPSLPAETRKRPSPSRMLDHRLHGHLADVSPTRRLGASAVDPLSASRRRFIAGGKDHRTLPPLRPSLQSFSEGEIHSASTVS